LLLIGIIFICGLIYTSKIVLKLSDKTWKIIKISSFILLLIFQFFAIRSYYFYNGWDSGVTSAISGFCAHNEEVPESCVNYISIYPNTRFLVFIEAAIKSFVHAIGLHDYEYFSIIFLQMIICCVTGFLLVNLTDYLLCNRRITYITFWLYIFLVGISPWISDPYTDSMALFVPISILCLYVYRKKSKYKFINWFFIGVLTIAGYQLKPQVIFITFAIIINEIITFTRKNFNKTALISICSLLVSIILTNSLINLANNSLEIEYNEGKRVDVYHYFSLGLNPETYGMWSYEDYLFSSSFDTVEERKAANINRAQERLKSLGLTGVISLYARKTISNYNSGTFCWGIEGHFFGEIPDHSDSSLSTFFQQLYYITDSRFGTDSEPGFYLDPEYGGEYYPVWANFAQMIWLVVLLIGAISSFDRKNIKKNLIAMSIIGLTLFLTIFECRGRYLFTFAPLYILLAAYGLKYISQRISEHKSKI